MNKNGSSSNQCYYPTLSGIPTLSGTISVSTKSVAYSEVANPYGTTVYIGKEIVDDGS